MSQSRWDSKEHQSASTPPTTPYEVPKSTDSSSSQNPGFDSGDHFPVGWGARLKYMTERYRCQESEKRPLRAPPPQIQEEDPDHLALHPHHLGLSALLYSPDLQLPPPQTLFHCLLSPWQ